MITIPEKKIPVRETCDVAVAGGGIAGCAAAIAAARAGAKVCLVERYAGLGGLATMGHIIVYLPLCDGRGRQVSFGLAEELLRLPMKYGSCKPAGAWAAAPLGCPDSGTPEAFAKHRFELRFEPGQMAVGLERLLVESGVEILYDTLVTDVAKNADGAISHLVVENKSGTSAIAAKTVVDASGDADVCRLCGEADEIDTNNAASAWYYTVTPGDRTLELQCGAGNYDGALGAGYCGADAKSVSAQLVKSRELILADLACVNRLRVERGEPSTELFYIPFFASFRMTRRLVARTTLSVADMHRWFDDAVGIFSDWRKPGPVYSLPWSALVAVKTPNLATAGRCISATGDTWDVTRVIPVCAVSGEAAGTGAALAAQTGTTLADLDIRLLQSTLRRNGVKLDPTLVAPRD